MTQPVRQWPFIRFRLEVQRLLALGLTAEALALIAAYREQA